MSVQKIMELFGSEFDDVRLFYKKKISLFEHHKKELDHVVKTTELLNKLLKEKFSEKQKIRLENLAEIIRRYWYNEEDQRKLALPIYYSFLDYMQEMTYMIRSEEVDPPFETYADVMYDVIQLLKVLVEEKKLEKYPPKDKRFQAVCRKCYIRQLSLFRLGYKVFRDEFWQELYLDESIAQPKSVLYVLDTNPSFEYDDYIYKYPDKPVVKAPDRRFQAFIEHYKDMLSEDRLLLDILNSPWGLKKHNRLFRLAGIASRVLIAQKYCNRVYVEKIHPVYDFFYEYMFETCARLGLDAWLFKYDNLEPVGAELCDLFQTFIKENKQLTYKTDNRYKEFTKKYFPYVDQIIILRRPYKKENEKLVKEWRKKYGHTLG